MFSITKQYVLKITWVWIIDILRILHYWVVIHWQIRMSRLLVLVHRLVISFSCLIAVASASSTVLWDNWQACAIRILVKFFGFFSFEDDVAVGLSLIAFNMLSTITSSSASLGILSWTMLDFSKDCFYISWNNHIIFLKLFVWFTIFTVMYVEPTL